MLFQINCLVDKEPHLFFLKGDTLTHDNIKDVATVLSHNLTNEQQSSIPIITSIDTVDNNSANTDPCHVIYEYLGTETLDLGDLKKITLAYSRKNIFLAQKTTLNEDGLTTRHYKFITA